MQVERLPGESELDFHRRIVYGKLVDKSLSDLDYTEISEILYGKPYASDNARRMLYGSRKTLELIDEELAANVAMDNCSKDIDEQMAELRKEKQRFFDQRREYNKLLSAEARTEHLYEALTDAANKLGSSIGRLYEDAPALKFNSQTDTSEAVLVLSDWHYGMKAHNIYNEFSTELCKQRVYRVVAQAAKKITLHNCDKLHVVVLGDLIHGAIHTSARVASEELVCDQIMQVSEILAQSIEYLSHYVSETDVHVTYGNHARTVQNKKDNIHRDNMERLIPWWLNLRLEKYDYISVVEDEGDEFCFLDVCGHGVCAVHGDNDNVKNSPRILSTLFHKKQGKDVEYILLGDKHHRESVEELGVTAMMCGSLCGTDDYSNNKRLFSTPSQLLLIMNEEDGVDAEYRIKCD